MLLFIQRFLIANINNNYTNKNNTLNIMGFNIISAAEAASYIKHGYNIGLSGFTPAGTPKGTETRSFRRTPRCVRVRRGREPGVHAERETLPDPRRGDASPAHSPGILEAPHQDRQGYGAEYYCILRVLE